MYVRTHVHPLYYAYIRRVRVIYIHITHYYYLLLLTAATTTLLQLLAYYVVLLYSLFPTEAPVYVAKNVDLPTSQRLVCGSTTNARYSRRSVTHRYTINKHTSSHNQQYIQIDSGNHSSTPPSEKTSDR
jgi:hypothetical protein